MVDDGDIMHQSMSHQSNFIDAALMCEHRKYFRNPTFFQKEYTSPLKTAETPWLRASLLYNCTPTSPRAADGALLTYVKECGGLLPPIIFFSAKLLAYCTILTSPYHLTSLLKINKNALFGHF
jgi:hypothetical protein